MLTVKPTASKRQPEAWTEKYRPQTLDGLLGQFEAVSRLKEFCDCPYPVAFLFEGPTGVGKTSAALALANELEIDRDWSFHHISSGAMDGEAVEQAVRAMRYKVGPNQYRMIIADEADTMSHKAKESWLSILEDIPPGNIIIFTTNNPERFQRRFLDRCERVRFNSGALLLQQDAENLVNQIWQAEGLKGEPISVAGNPDIIADGSLSFRAVVQAVRSASYGRRPTVSVTIPEPKPMAEKKSKTTSGYTPKPGYRIVIEKTLGETRHELYVNAGGWRFERVTYTGESAAVTITHSVKVGGVWEAEIRAMQEVANV